MPSDLDLIQRLRPIQAGLRPDIEVTRHVFRGEATYVIRDPISFQSYSLPASEYRIVVALNQARSLGEIFDQLVEINLLDADREEEFFHFVLRLQQLGFLVLPVTDGRALHRRYERRQATQRWNRLTQVLFLRIPLLNPDLFLRRTTRLVRPLFTPVAVSLWLGLMCVCAVILHQRWDTFRSPLQSLMATENLPILWCSLVGLKILHEFGHAYACRIFGGTVPEMGVFLIVGTPCAYVDASAAWGFPRRRHRIFVSLAGMYFESTAAAIALLVWNWTQPSLLNAFAHQIVILASFVTIGFNINPLLRYDGYYVLSDLVDMPNLRQKSLAQVTGFLKWFFLGIRGPQIRQSLPVRTLLFVYGCASGVYKVVVVLAICTMIAWKFYLLGVLMAGLFLASMVGGILRRLAAYLWRSSETAPVRGRAIAWSVVLLAGAPLAMLAVPLPRQVQLDGVVHYAREQTVFASGGGFLVEPLPPPGSPVARNQQLVKLHNAALLDECRTSQAEREWLEVQQRCLAERSPSAACQAGYRVAQLDQRWEQRRRQLERLTVTSTREGIVTWASPAMEPGDFVRIGQPLLSVGSGPWMVRCLATADQLAALEPQEGQEVVLKFLADTRRTLRARIHRVAAEGRYQITELALTQLGGGHIAVHPETLRSSEPFFTVELLIPVDPSSRMPLVPGMKAVMLRTSGTQTGGQMLYERLLQFLHKLHVGNAN